MIHNEIARYERNYNVCRKSIFCCSGYCHSYNVIISIFLQIFLFYWFILHKHEPEGTTNVITKSID